MSLKITYREIINVLEKEELLVEHNIDNLDAQIDFISHDSRNIVENTLFFCKGVGFKEEYLWDAIKKGAVCYESEKKYDLNGLECKYIIVSNIRQAIAIVAPLYYNYAYKNLELIGITGTKGKTTVAYFIKNIMDEFANYETGLISTTETYTGKQRKESHITTPEPCDLQRYFHEAHESGIKYFTMEVSSQAYKTDRVKGITFNNGMFLNISEDHIGPQEHDDFEDYLNCKSEFIRNCSNIVINVETDCFEHVLKAAKSSKTLTRITLYGSEKYKNKCDYYYLNLKKENGVLTFTVKNDKIGYCENFAIKTQGIFNVENATAAVAMCKTIGVDCESIRRGLLKTEVPGRMSIFENNGVTIIVDYAHNLLSYMKLYETLKADYPNSKIISVGGTPGGKSFNRRKDFAAVVGVHSDHIYLTSDDPQFEDVTKICEEIASYMPNASYEIIPDRVEAITKAVANAKSGDIVALIGKGAENYQRSNGQLVPYECDLNIAQRLLFE